MIRILWLLLLAAIAAGLVAWFADRPGAVAINWLGWRIETSVGLMLLAVSLLGIAIGILYRLWRGIVTTPRRIRHWASERRRRRGLAALTDGLVAIAAGDAEAARRQVRRTDLLLGEPPLTLLLSAQAAQLAGDEATAKRQFTAMLARPETAFLGLRGLMTQAMKSGDHAEALRLARRARELRPKAQWVLQALMDLEVQAGEWAAASRAIGEAKKAGVLPAATAASREAALQLEISRAAVADGRNRDALVAAERAHRLAPEHPATSAWLAGRYAAAGKARAASHLVEREWPRHAHPDLLAAYRAARPPATPLDWLKQVQRLAATAPTRVASLAALGEAALDAGLWGEARRHLEAAVTATGDQPTIGLCRLMARLEEQERGDAEALKRWLARAAMAPPDPAWICDACGAPHVEWSARCTRCGAFDRMAWRAPATVGPASLGRPRERAAAGVVEGTAEPPARPASD